MSNSKSPISGRIPSDIASRFEDFRKQHDLNQTDALKRLLQTGLEHEIGEKSGENQRIAFVSEWFRTLGVVLLALSVWSVMALSRAQLTFVLAAAGVVVSGSAYHLRSRADE